MNTSTNTSMKCDDALLEMLGADSHELRGEGTSSLAAHVRRCGRCGAVASRMFEETSALASAIATTPVAVRPTRSRAPALVLAAAAVVLIVVYPKEPQEESASSVSSAVSVPPAVAVAAAAAAPIVARNPVRRRATATPVSATTISTVPYEFASPVLAVRIATAPVDSAAATEPSTGLVAVTPPSGVRARVTQTRNPSITVVWLSKK